MLTSAMLTMGMALTSTGIHLNIISELGLTFSLTPSNNDLTKPNPKPNRYANAT
jgi:hypothetical protein